MGKLLGEGAFGMVMKAEAIGIGDSKGVSTVAVKMLKGGSKLAGILLSRHGEFMPKVTKFHGMEQWNYSMGK